MSRKKLKAIRANFQRIFELTDSQMELKEYTVLRQQALARVAIWDGRFPGESVEDAVNVRQMDAGARQDSPHILSNYLRRMGVTGQEKDDWSCIFYAFKHYVYGHETDKDILLANKIYGGIVQEEEESVAEVAATAEESKEDEAKDFNSTGNKEVSRDQQEHDRASESVMDNQHVEEGAEDGLPHRTAENKRAEKENKTMASLSSVEEMLQKEAEGKEVAAGGPIAPATMNPGAVQATGGKTNTTVDVSNVGTANMASVNAVVDTEWANRQAWSAARKIAKIVCAGKQPYYKLIGYNGPESQIMGELANTADKTLHSIAVSMYSVDLNKRENGGKTLKKEVPADGVGYIFDEATKQVKFPECVKRAGQAACDDFKAMIELLVQAGQTKPQLQVKITKSKPSITGVAIDVNDGSKELYKMGEMKEAMVTNSDLSVEYFRYNSGDPTDKHSILAAAAVTKIDAKKIGDQSSYIKLAFGNRGTMFDKDTGELTEYGESMVSFAREITEEQDTNPRAVTSVTSFQYKTPEGKTRTYALRVVAPSKSVRIVEEYRALVGATAGGNVTKIPSDAARSETVKLLNAIACRAPGSSIGQKVAASSMKGSASADAALAQEAVGAASDYES